jgi:choline dehydrogenase-like flavoprotein
MGGRTNQWARISLRMSEWDFKPHSTDGVGDDWAISYQDLAPYYDKVEAYIGVYGSKDNVPSTPDGIFQLPPKPRCYELLAKKACDKLGILCIAGRRAVITQPTHGRLPCHYCGQCERGCTTASHFNSALVLIPPAMETKRLETLPQAMAREILVDDAGKAQAVSYVDKTTGQEKEVRARAVVVAASACESARLLLNSHSEKFPNGLANSSGVVGRYLTDSLGSSMTGYFPQLERLPPHDDEGAGGMHMFIPWWKWKQKNDFLRGYHIEFGGGRHMPYPGTFHGVCRRVEGFGGELKRHIRRVYGAFMGFHGRGEMIPNDKTYCEIDPNVVDRWGIPVLRFHYEWTDNDIRMAKDMQETFEQIILTAGGEPLKSPPSPERPHHLYRPGEILHELGTVRMGGNPRASALNGFCQAHDVRNLFVMDGGCFVSQPDKNPTLTILALAWRASDHLLEEARKGNL